ncbi:unnamed protein product [Microthlaspi erraticum]|uniref:Arabidopsis retrotransposon Orf1 C-terminal domain-containing protein n=1 Tax=Microthlaspi erraticum TaxID=1685480 RepID=A0A6D2HTY0_9BRAS|nr:unnamed protein product [Microthlaspi erraticum]
MNADLGEPECYYFEEYEAPRMNPSVVAAHKRIGLLQRFNKWQGKAMEKMQKSMDKMGREDNSQRRRKSSKARRSSSTTGLDRVQTEETQLDRAEGRVDLEEPLFENPGFEYDPTQYQDFSQTWTPYNRFEQASSTKAKEPHTFQDEEEKEEEPQARSSEPNPVEWSVLMAVYHLQTTT